MNLILKFYLVVLILAIYLFILLSNLSNSKFFNNLIKIQKANQVYSSKEEKLNYVFGPSSDSFEERCQILKGNSKSSLERLFYGELSLCNNKTQIDRLIYCYMSIISRNHLEFDLEFLLSNLLFILIKFFFSRIDIFYYGMILNMISSIYLIVLAINEKQFNRSFLLTSERKFYLRFFTRLSYLSPMVSLKETLDESEIEGSIYNTLYDDVNENKISEYAVKKVELTTCLFKILTNNKFNNEKILVDYYEESLDCTKGIFSFVNKYYFVFIFILVLGVVVTL